MEEKNIIQKIALLGKGKTGGKVLELIKESGLPYSVFDSSHFPTAKALEGHDVIISFLPGEAFKTYIPLFIETKIPVVCGSTGMLWPSELDLALKARGVKWIYATNFSLGMNLIHQMILALGRANKIFKNYQYNLVEVHHTKKLDAPSGTALSWKAWLGDEVNIASERKGDVVGIHELRLTTPHEEITLRHEALDRKIFAEGAMYAAHKILNDKTLAPGLHLFQDIVKEELGFK